MFVVEAGIFSCEQKETITVATELQYPNVEFKIHHCFCCCMRLLLSIAVKQLNILQQKKKKKKEIRKKKKKKLK